MSNEKQEIIKRMKELQTLIPDTIKAVKSLPDGLDMYTLLDPGELMFVVDYIPSEYLALRRHLAKNWKYTSKNFNQITGDYYVYLQHRTLKVKLGISLSVPSEYQEGINCRLIEIGHKTETIYGLECR